MVVPGASEAVSGCNILILPVDASVLRALERLVGGRKRSAFAIAGACAHTVQSHFGSGFSIAFKHCLIPGSRLVTEVMAKVRTA
jgi:hypothetical protein